MLLTGKQKAAMLLMSLDAASAAELLKGVDPEVIRELSAELAHLENAGFKGNRQSLKLVRKFCKSLQTRQEFRLQGFLKEMLSSTVGAKKAEHIHIRIRELLHKRDPFTSLNSVESQKIASILEHEHPQTAAVVLSGLSTEKNLEVLSFMDGRVGFSAVGRMHKCKTMTAEAKAEIAEEVCRHLEPPAAGRPGRTLSSWPEQSLRKVAVILRNLRKEIRDGMVGAIQKEDSQAGEMVADLMIVWEDIPEVADDSLHEALSGIDAGKLALALTGAGERIVQKIKACLCESASGSLEKELLHTSGCKGQDVEEARDHVVHVLRELNAQGELSFVEEASGM